MPISNINALEQIDGVLKRRNQLDMKVSSDVVESITLICAAIQRLAPPGSAYPAEVEKARKTVWAGTGNTHACHEEELFGILRALRTDYEAGRVRTFQELVHADLFSDFLEMAEHLLEEGYKDAAAVIGGGVLEEHLRKLCSRHGVGLAARPKLDMMNADLAKTGAYGKNEQKQVTAWAGLRNDAAHGEYAKYVAEQVKFMLMGIRDFIGRFPA